MKLSDAIERGRIVEEPGAPATFRECAIGIAMAGVGVPYHERSGEKAFELWPWLKNPTYEGSLCNFRAKISWFYVNVVSEKATLGQLVDWVRSVEPKEDGAQ